MPHDKNGAPLSVGDKVTVECEIVSICEGEYCTTELKTVEVMPGNGEKTHIGAINAKQLVKAVLIALALCLFASDAYAGCGLFGRFKGRRGGSAQSCGPVASAGVASRSYGVPYAVTSAGTNCAECDAFDRSLQAAPVPLAPVATSPGAWVKVSSAAIMPRSELSAAPAYTLRP